MDEQEREVVTSDARAAERADGAAPVAGSVGALDATVTLRSTSSLRLLGAAARDLLAGELTTDGRLHLTLALPGGVEHVGGQHRVHGPITLHVPLPGGTLTIPATLDGSVHLGLGAPDGVRLDAQGTIDAPLAARVPLANKHGEMELDARLSGDASLGMGLPGGHGQIEAQLRAVGPWALRLELPDEHGWLTARGALSTPLSLSLVLPDGQVKLGLHEHMVVHLAVHRRLPDGGRVEATAPIDVRCDGVLVWRAGRGELQAMAPFRSRVQVSQLMIPGLDAPLSLAIPIHGAADVTADLPSQGTRVRAYFTAALPLAPVVRLLQTELERHVRVENIELCEPQLRGAHDVALPLLVGVRRGVAIRLEVTAYLRIDPRSKQVELRSVHADGLNAAGHAAAGMYLNPRLLRSLRHTLLVDPSRVLPPTARLQSLGFKAASRAELSVEGVLAWRGTA